ncbi:hypothetical protein GLOIN_2v1880770 [Rhizophagus irregularis DAOM 181602=DAOM 197198]|nr:hypothetical protein GLOIN_2v1880770 [Rhizophagus irregularis DAOM 181602=DAOM 197198]
MEEINFDCLVLIFNILKNDKKSLHSCLLVNKKWCNLVVPILWKSYSLDEINEKLCNVILSFLPSSSKKLLSDFNPCMDKTTVSGYLEKKIAIRIPRFLSG